MIPASHHPPWENDRRSAKACNGPSTTAISSRARSSPCGTVSWTWPPPASVCVDTLARCAMMLASSAVCIPATVIQWDAGARHICKHHSSYHLGGKHLGAYPSVQGKRTYAGCCRMDCIARNTGCAASFNHNRCQDADGVLLHDTRAAGLLE